MSVSAWVNVAVARRNLSNSNAPVPYTTPMTKVMASASGLAAKKPKPTHTTAMAPREKAAAKRVLFMYVK